MLVEPAGAVARRDALGDAFGRLVEPGDERQQQPTARQPVELGELAGQHVRVAAGRHEVRAELQPRHACRGERQADERVDAAAWNDSGSHTESKPSPSRSSRTVPNRSRGSAPIATPMRTFTEAMMYQMVSVDDVRAFALTLPRAYEVLVRDRVKFRVGRIVFVVFSRDETMMGFGFPKEEREALIASEPEKFLLPEPSDMRYQWVVVRLAAIDVDEMRELVLDAWRMCVPKKVSALVP